MDTYPITNRNKVKRIPKRGHYDRQSVYSILDAGFLAHVGFVQDQQPYVIPMAYGRTGDTVYLHGATKSRLMTHGATGIPVCLTVTHLDGLVLARASFHNSMNYRSAVLFGKARVVSESKKEEALYIISEQILPGRWDNSRKPNARELKATTVLEVAIEQASAKIRTGPPKDDREDYELGFWAGVLPFRRELLAPDPDPELPSGIKIGPEIEAMYRAFNNF